MRKWLVCIVAISAAVPILLEGQGGPPPAPAKAQSPKQAAPIDITGYWVPLITEDWLYRQVTPGKAKNGAANVDSIPVTPAARDLANRWDPAKDEAAGEQCKAYGAIGLTRLPGRIHIEWQDDNTLKVDFEAGTQTRLLHFGGTPPLTGDAGYQGYSLGNWEGGGRGRGGAAKGAPAPRGGSLKVVTTRLKPGYLRKNGIPYGARATLTEYFDRLNEPDGQTLLLVKSIVEDPEFLTQPFITSTHFKKEPDGSKWSPNACSAR